MSTGWTCSPSFIVGMKSHFLFRSRGSVFIPLGTNGPAVFHIFVRGFCSPSYICFSIPGPSFAVSGFCVFSTSSYGLTPLVSSYTCIAALFPWILIISPISLSVPMCTTSPIFGV